LGLGLVVIMAASWTVVGGAGAFGFLGRARHQISLGPNRKLPLSLEGTSMRELRIHMVLPVRVTWTESERAMKQMACTIDVSQRGARLAGITGLRAPGQLIAVRRNTSEAQFRVVWVGTPRTPHEGHVGVECVEADKIIWDVDFDKVHEDFEPLKNENLGLTKSRSLATPARPQHYSCTGRVLVWADEASSDCHETELLAISLAACRVEAVAGPWIKLALLLQILTEDTQVTVKGIASAKEQEAGNWVEFTHIRRGDRWELQALIARLSGQKGIV
jgi:hypothetical protein